MLPLLLLISFSPDEVRLHCRADGADRLQTQEFTLLERAGKVRYPDMSGVLLVDATFSADTITFPDSWPKPAEGLFAIDRASLTFRHVVRYKDSVLLEEHGRCTVHAPPPPLPDDGRGARPPAD